MPRALYPLLLLLMLPRIATAADLANGERVNLSCAPCHGRYGQGVAGKTSPRLAGLPAWYLAKATKDFKNGARKHPLMFEVAGLDRLSEADIADVSTYLAGLDIGTDPAYDIRSAGGDIDAGKAKFDSDCKTCHGKDGYGKKKKDAPPLAGQYPRYLFSSIKAFYAKDRYHDNDPIDDTFDDISDAQAWNILAYTASLDDARLRPDYQFRPPRAVPAQAMTADKREDGGFRFTTVTQNLLIRELDEGVSPQEAIAAMLAKAKRLGLHRQGAPFDSGDLQARPEPAVVALQFCRPRQVRDMIAASPLLAAYPPCRITLVTVKDARPRLLAVNMEMLIDNRLLPIPAQRVAILVNQDMLAIMSAGAKGGWKRSLHRVGER